MRPYRAHHHSHVVHNSILVVFRTNDLSALMLKSIISAHWISPRCATAPPSTAFAAYSEHREL